MKSSFVKKRTAEVRVNTKHVLYGLVLCSSFISLYYFSGYPKWSANSSLLYIKGGLMQISAIGTEQRTSINHLVFGLVGKEVSWRQRKGLGEAWWRRNSTIGYLYLEKEPEGDLLPWSPASPPYRVSDDLTEFIREVKPASPNVIRYLHAIFEIMREEEGKESFRWLIMGDDDTVFFVDNLVGVLAEYDHSKFYYIGSLSESILSNHFFSFNTAFGGAGFALSYPLAKLFASTIESCLRRYPKLITADTTDMSCIADLGVNLTPQKGFHQIDIRGDISGLLSSNLMAPLLSLHHFDVAEPIFPTMNRVQSIQQLMKAGNVDQSRLMQQTICHDRKRGWSVSVSWGYSVHIYEKIYPRSWLQLPIQTFSPWFSHLSPPIFMFNTRLPSRDPCEAPHVFFFDSIEKWSENTTLSTYNRISPRELSPCRDAGHSADVVSHIHVYSPATKRKEMSRSECCDIDSWGTKNLIVKFRECMPREILA